MDLLVAQNTTFWPQDVDCVKRLRDGANNLLWPAVDGVQVRQSFYDLDAFEGRLDAVGAALTM